MYQLLFYWRILNHVSAVQTSANLIVFDRLLCEKASDVVRAKMTGFIHDLLDINNKLKVRLWN